MPLFRLTSPAASLTTFFTALIFLSAIAAPSSHALPDKFLPPEHLEESADAPMYIFEQGVSAPMISQQGPFTSYQVNVTSNGQNITGDAANEPSITVDPTNRNKMSIGWRQFNNVSSNFRQAGYGFTSNGGVSWTFPGVLDNVFRSDPVLAPDATGNFFYNSLLGNLSIDIWRSLTGGQSWTRLGPAFGGDKQWFTIDTTHSPGRGFQYQYWSTASNPTPGKQFTRSIDGGFTWMQPVSLPHEINWGMLDVNANGDLFLVGVDAGVGPDEKIWCIRSTNARFAAITPTFDLATAANMGGNVSAGDPLNPVGITGQINLAIDRSGSSTNNNVYLLASLKPFSAPNTTDVMFVRSTDNGQTFSAPRRINDDPANAGKWHWFGALSVAPDGRLDAVWLDTRNAAGNGFDSQLFYSYSRDGGDTWSANVAVSQPFNPLLGYPNQNKIGDYMTIVSDLGGGNVAYPATFNGEQDVYYVRVAPPSVKLLNLATRARVLTGEQVLIAGFIITGTDPKRVIIRGIGPSLNVSGKLSDPTLALHQGSTQLASNDNWKTKPDGTSQQAEVEATTIPPTNDAESAIVMTLSPGSYTATLSGVNGGTGIGVVEVYDLEPAVNSRLANISTRGFVDMDDNAMIAGLIAGQGETGATAQVLIRAIGPSLGNSGIQGPLQDPTLALFDANGATLATNDNWKINDQTQQSQEDLIRSSTIAPSNDLEAAIVTTLPPGPNTAVVRGKNNTTGVGLVEVYNLQ